MRWNYFSRRKKAHQGPREGSVHHTFIQTRKNFDDEQRKHARRVYRDIGITIGTLAGGAVALYCLNQYASEPATIEKMIFTREGVRKFDARK